VKITYTKAESLEIMRNHIADLLDVEVTEITVSNYSEDYLNVACTKVEKVTAPRRWIKDPKAVFAYVSKIGDQDPTPKVE
jgi:hypothetical protein